MGQGLLSDYSRQAESYDLTRSASPAVAKGLRAAIADAPGRRLADIGGGTGNYALALAEHGWEPLVIDRSPEMLKRAADKGLATLLASAERLPLDDASFDAALMVSMLHHTDDPADALGEARRILRPGGRLALKMFTREEVEDLWLNAYFPSTRSWMNETHPSLAEFEHELPGAEVVRLLLADLEDGSLEVLAGHPRLVLEERWRRQTSYFERLERDHHDELNSGLKRLAEDLANGRAPRKKPGSATLIVWRKPGR
jgi:ubiquinone/menaquinone biosynthesis C-methylase UbiE